MKIKLNFKADAPTVNGHVYRKEVLKKSFDEKISKGHFFVQQYNDDNDFSVNFENVFAEVESYEIKPNSEIFIDVKLLDTPVAEKFKAGNFELTIAGIGIFENDNKTIADGLMMSHLFVVGGKGSE